jgi:hypothetical protein
MREPEDILSRRGFFGDVRTVGAVAVAASLVPSVRQRIDATGGKAPSEAGGGYQVTEHVKRYYQTTRT